MVLWPPGAYAAARHTGVSIVGDVQLFIPQLVAIWVIYTLATVLNALWTSVHVFLYDLCFLFLDAHLELEWLGCSM